MPPLTPIRSPVALLRFSDLRHPERAVLGGTLVKVRPGVYAAAAEWKALAPWERYLGRVFAAALIHPDAVFSHESAAALLGMPVFGNPRIVHVVVPAHGTARMVAGIRVHTSHGDRAIVEQGGMMATSPADTAVDLARSRHAAIGLAMADAALRTEPTLTAERLLLINEARTSKRGRALARWPLASATAMSETALESISRAVVHWLGFAPPTLQVSFRTPGGQIDRGDFVWAGSSLIGEADGDLKFDGRFGDPRTLLGAQRQRDARLRAHHVRSIAHWGWIDATTVDPLRSLLLGHGLVPVGPEHTAQLFSLRRSVSPAPPHRASAGETASGRRDRG